MGPRRPSQYCVARNVVSSQNICRDCAHTIMRMVPEGTCLIICLKAILEGMVWGDRTLGYARCSISPLGSRHVHSMRMLQVMIARVLQCDMEGHSRLQCYGALMLPLVD